MIAQTPAARPSTPSEKLTTFIIATSPITVRIGPAFVDRCRGSAGRRRTGSVIALTSTPKCTTTNAATSWPASFAAGWKSKRSSSAPTSVISAAPKSTPCQTFGVRAVAGRQPDRAATSDAGEDREAAEQRRRALREPALARLVDRPHAPRERHRQRREQGRHGRGREKRVERVELAAACAISSRTGIVMRAQVAPARALCGRGAQTSRRAGSAR